MKLHKDVKNKIAIRTFNSLEEKFKKQHGDKYNYSKVVYYNTMTKIKIICPIHGEFTQTPNEHMRGGCRRCAEEELGKSKRKTTEQFLKEVKEIHGDTYDFSKVNYVTNAKRVHVVCRKHGRFGITPSSLLAGHACSKCAYEANGLKGRLTQERFIDRANKIHNSFYSYAKTDYTLAANKVIITCPIHGDFTQLAYSHLDGQGCPVCANSKKSYSTSTLKQKTILYLVKIKNTDCIKIGVTSTSITRRFGSDANKIEVLDYMYFDTGVEAKMYEQVLLSKFFNYRYEGEALLKTGNKEILIRDVFNGSLKKEVEMLNLPKIKPTEDD